VLPGMGDNNHKGDILALVTNKRMKNIPSNNKYIEMLVLKNYPTNLRLFL